MIKTFLAQDCPGQGLMKDYSTLEKFKVYVNETNQ